LEKNFDNSSTTQPWQNW